jgi:hypothetical protein
MRFSSTSRGPSRRSATDPTTIVQLADLTLSKSHVGDFRQGQSGASYSLLVHMLCQQLGMKPGRYIHSMGDAHIYTNQIDGVKEQLTRELRPLPTLEIVRKPDSIFGYKVEDFDLAGYNPNEKIDYPIAV